MGLPEQVCSTEDATTKKRLPSFNVFGTIRKHFFPLDDTKPIGKVMNLLQRMLPRVHDSHVTCLPITDDPETLTLREYIMNWWQNRHVVPRLREGDLLVFPRRLYSHWAVYIGNVEVVHLTGDSNTSSHGAKGMVKRENLWKVAKGSLVEINNSLDGRLRPFPAPVIVERALKKVGETGYNVVFKNCEHFAVDCRYGVKMSQQVNSAIQFPQKALNMTTDATVGSISGE